MIFWQMTGWRAVLENRALDIYAHELLRIGGINGFGRHMLCSNGLKGLKLQRVVCPMIGRN